MGLIDVSRRRLLRLCALAALSALPARAQGPRDPETYVFVQASDAAGLDPGSVSDTPSNHVIANCYESLLSFKSGSVRELVPVLATSVPSAANGLVSPDGLVYRFPLRSGVRFPDGRPLTPEDVRHSFLRQMLIERPGTNSTEYLTVVIGRASARFPGVYAEAAAAVSAEKGAVVFRLKRPFAAFPAMAATVPILSRSWLIEQGDWDGREETLAARNDPKAPVSPLSKRTFGTGPYQVERWDKANRTIILGRNERYWRGPARLRRIVLRAVPEVGTRLLMLKAGDADNVQVSPDQTSLVRGIPGVVVDDRGTNLSIGTALLFNFHISSAGNPDIGSGRLDGEGIPPDFFANPDVRKGFAYALDTEAYQRDVLRGNGFPVATCIPDELWGSPPASGGYPHDVEKAKEHLRRAWGGKVWEKGFRLVIIHTPKEGANIDPTTALLKRSIESLNPRFRIESRVLQWSSLLDNVRSGRFTLWISGMQGSYADPHPFAHDFLHSEGSFPKRQSYRNPRLDELIERAASTTDPSRREALYREIIAIEREDVPHVIMGRSRQLRVQRDWVKGWVYHPLLPHNPHGSSYYDLSKRP